MTAEKKYVAFIIFLIAALVYQCESHSRFKDNTAANIATITDSVQHYKNALGTQTATVKTLQLSQRNLNSQFLEKDPALQSLSKEFSTIKSVIKYQSITRIDTIKIRYRDTVPCIFERSGNVKNMNYSFVYDVTQKGMEIDSVYIPTSVTLLTGTKRKWLMGKEYVTTDITNSNPLVSIQTIQSAEVIISHPWYKKWYVWLGAGLAGGIFIAK
jgi:hypothetical protein